MKHILLSLCGITPQIITETLYGLMIQRQIPIEEISLVTTHEGQTCILDTLLGNGTGIYYQFCQDYQLAVDKIKFDNSQIYVAPDLTRAPEAQGGLGFPDLILDIVREKTRSPETVLHCSLAGGRKTMSIYFALAMQFYGRAQDKLYHIMVCPPEFENNPGFYYPPPQPQMIRTPNGQLISTTQAHIELAEIPIIKLSNRTLFETPNLTYTEMVALTQNELSQMPVVPALQIDIPRRVLRIATHQILLTPIEMAVYVYYAHRSLNRKDQIRVTDYEQYFETAEGNFFPETALARLLEIYKQIAPEGMLERFTSTLVKGMLEFERVVQYFSRIKGKIQRALGDEIPADFYLIAPVGRYRKCYGIKLDKSKIKIIDFPAH